MKRRFTTTDALLDHDESEPLDPGVFDDALWLLLSDAIAHPSELSNHPEPVGVYLASRWLEWEVGNGGFAQAAFNIPEWFVPAAAGYLALGKHKSVELIQEALSLLEEERETLKSKSLLDGATIERVFLHFTESRMAALDERIPEDEWWIDEERIAYVRKHRNAFRGIDARCDSVNQ